MFYDLLSIHLTWKKSFFLLASFPFRTDHHYSFYDIVEIFLTVLLTPCSVGGFRLARTTEKTRAATSLRASRKCSRSIFQRIFHLPDFSTAVIMQFYAAIISRKKRAWKNFSFIFIFVECYEDFSEEIAHSMTPCCLMRKLFIYEIWIHSQSSVRCSRKMCMGSEETSSLHVHAHSKASRERTFRSHGRFCMAHFDLLLLFLWRMAERWRFLRFYDTRKRAARFAVQHEKTFHNVRAARSHVRFVQISCRWAICLASLENHSPFSPHLDRQKVLKLFYDVEKKRLFNTIFPSQRAKKWKISIRYGSCGESRWSSLKWPVSDVHDDFSLRGKVSQFHNGKRRLTASESCFSHTPVNSLPAPDSISQSPTIFISARNSKKKQPEISWRVK